MTMLLLKLAMSVALGAGGIVCYRLLQRQRLSLRMMQILFGVTVCAKIGLAVALYALKPELNTSSDLVEFYLPQAHAVSEGQVPYRDFGSSYSFLFPFMLAAATSVWHSPGAVPVMMTGFELIMLAVFFRRFPLNPADKLLVAIVYCWSYFSFYFVSLTGYNGIIIACFVMVSLIESRNGATLLNELWFQLGFWLSKLLILLYAPVVVLARPRTARRIALRFVPFLLTGLLLVIMQRTGFDVTQPVRQEAQLVTAGNLPFLLLLSADASQVGLITVCSLGLFAVLALWCCYKVLREPVPADAQSYYVQMLSMIVFLSMCFMLLSKKTWFFYYEMFYFPLVLFVMLSAQHRARNLILLWALNVLTPIEIFFQYKVRITYGENFLNYSHHPQILALVACDLCVIALNLYFAQFAYRTIVSGRGTNSQNAF